MNSNDKSSTSSLSTWLGSLKTTVSNFFGDRAHNPIMSDIQHNLRQDQAQAQQILELDQWCRVRKFLPTIRTYPKEVYRCRVADGVFTILDANNQLHTLAARQAEAYFQLITPRVPVTHEETTHESNVSHYTVDNSGRLVPYDGAPTSSADHAETSPPRSDVPTEGGSGGGESAIAPILPGADQLPGGGEEGVEGDNWPTPPLPPGVGGPPNPKHEPKGLPGSGATTSFPYPGGESTPIPSETIQKARGSVNKHGSLRPRGGHHG